MAGAVGKEAVNFLIVFLTTVIFLVNLVTLLLKVLITLLVSGVGAGVVSSSGVVGATRTLVKWKHLLVLLL